ncbi:hypothetical protein [Mesorhizobium sp. B1-1-8]|uniref:hypothetical protein n=1 Tax=Mesorhizobium sp. B1-1-8 TaxID=2589976 RepID=UPI0011267FA8|nr:hypothetical protein [Mesorhizobium sp. B1-1-8]UCI07367.1 hypothetical protein FJ974_26885 [Mesorhizobium sp. B1-1-8]
MTATEAQPDTDNRATQQFVLLLLLLLFYCLGPIVVIFAALISIHDSPAQNLSSKLDETLVLQLVTAIAKDPGIYTNVLHQMIMPVAAVITAANTSALRVRGVVTYLFILPLFTIFICLVDAAIFNTFSPSDNKGVTSQLFISAAGNLATYVMLIVGLKIGDAKKG